MYLKIIGWAELLTGIFFMFNSVTDIQLGFGFVLIYSGLKTIISVSRSSDK